MVIAHRSNSSPLVTVGSDPMTAVGLPAGTQSGDMVCMYLAWKHSTVTVAAQPTSWQDPANNDVTGGPATTGLDIGSVTTDVWFRQYDGVWTMPTIDMSAVPDTAVFGATAYSKASNEIWDPVICASAADTTADATGLSVDPAVSGTTIALGAGDLLGHVWGINTDGGSSPSVPTVTVSGVTLTGGAKRVDQATTAGNDMRLITGDHAYSSGTAAAGPDGVLTYTVSGGTGIAGGVIYFRLRVTLAPEIPLLVMSPLRVR